jgi:hypothetical protein
MFKKLSTLCLLLSFAAQAGLPPPSVQGQSDTSAQTKFNFQVPYNQKTDLGGIKALFETGNQNLLSNPSFEHTTFSTSWTATTVSPTKDTTNIINGKQSALLSPSAQTFTLSNDVTPTIQISNVNMEASCRVKTTQSGIQVCSRAAGASVNCVSVPNDGNWDYVPVNFVGPASGSVGVQVSAASAVTGTVNVDDCYVGTARNIGTVAQAYLVGQVKITGCASNWTTNSTSLAAFSAQTSCVYTASGQASAPGTMIPGITFASLPPGNYALKYEGLVNNTYSSVSGFSSFQFWDGTNTAAEVSSTGYTTSSNVTIGSPGISQTITYSAPQSNVTLSIRGAINASGSSANLFGTTSFPGVISVYYFPTSAQSVVAANQQTQPTVTKLLSGSGTYTTPAGVTRLEIEMVGGGGGGSGAGAGAGAGITGGNTTFGTSLLVANGGVGGPFSSYGGVGGTASLGTGPIGIALQGGAGAGTSVGSATNIGGQGASSPFGGTGSTVAGAAGLAAIPNTGAGGSGGGGGNGINSGAGGGAGGYVKAVITNPSATYTYSVGGSGAGGTAGTSGTAGGASGSGAIYITEYYQGQNAPILTNSITTNAAGAWRVESAHVGFTSSTCSVASGTGFATASFTTGPTCAITFTVPFSGTPTCVVSGDNEATYTALYCRGAAYAGGNSVSCFTGGTQVGDNFSIICQGPR